MVGHTCSIFFPGNPQSLFLKEPYARNLFFQRKSVTMSFVIGHGRHSHRSGEFLGVHRCVLFLSVRFFWCVMYTTDFSVFVCLRILCVWGQNEVVSDFSISSPKNHQSSSCIMVHMHLIQSSNMLPVETEVFLILWDDFQVKINLQVASWQLSTQCE